MHTPQLTEHCCLQRVWTECEEANGKKILKTRTQPILGTYIKQTQEQKAQTSIFSPRTGFSVFSKTFCVKAINFSLKAYNHWGRTGLLLHTGKGRERMTLGKTGDQVTLKWEKISDRPVENQCMQITWDACYTVDSEPVGLGMGTKILGYLIMLTTLESQFL